MSTANALHGTTILAVRHRGGCAIAGDGQVTMGRTVMKQGAKKIRRMHNGQVLAGLRGLDRGRHGPLHEVRGQDRGVPRQPRARRRGAGQGMAHRPRDAPAGGVPDRRRPRVLASSSPARATSSPPTTGSWPWAAAAPTPWPPPAPWPATPRSTPPTLALEAMKIGGADLHLHERPDHGGEPLTAAPGPPADADPAPGLQRGAAPPSTASLRARSWPSSTATWSARPRPSARWPSRSATASAASAFPRRWRPRSRPRTSS